MKRFCHCKLTKELIVLFTLGVPLILYSAFQDYYRTLDVQAQLQQQQPTPIISIKITSPSTGQQVPTGELTISGTSTDNATTDCTVYADWNNTKPFQTATATGPAGVNDYSRWTFTYTNNYHLITNGTNNLTSKLSCVGNDSNVGTANLTKSYSVNVIGVIESPERQELDEEEVQQNNGSSNFSSSPSFPSVNGNNEDNNTSSITPSEDPTIYWDLEDLDEDNNHGRNLGHISNLE
jgi:hypothetical protein